MTSVQELIATGRDLGLDGVELNKFIREQQALAREERERERGVEREKLAAEKEKLVAEKERLAWEDSRRDKDQQFELEKMRLAEQTRRLEIQAKVAEDSMNRSHQTDEHEVEIGPDFGIVTQRDSRVRGPKMTPFEEKDDMGSYIHRFEKYAEIQKWRRTDWAIYLASLLKGRALDVYARLPPEHAQDYEVLKQALLKRYALTEEGYKQKFYESRPEKGESPQQFIVRIKSYFERWLELARVDPSFEGVVSLMVKERYLATCHKSMELFLRERALIDLDDLAKLAEQYEDAHGPRPSSKKEPAPSSPRKYPSQEGGKAQNRSRPQESQEGQRGQGSPKRPKPQCYACGKMGHIARNCFQRQKTGAMEVDDESEEEVGAMIQSGQRQNPSSQGGYRNFARRANVSVESQNQASSSQADKSAMPYIYCKPHRKAFCQECFTNVPSHVCNAMLGTDVELKCGCTAPVLAEACDVISRLKAKMPVADGKLDGSPVKVLRDTGCSTIVVKRALITDVKLTGRVVVCVMIDGTARRYPTAVVEIESPFISGTVEAVCMDRPLYDLIIGNVPGAQETVQVEPVSVREVRENTVEVQAVVTRAQAKKEHKVKSLNVAESIDCGLSTDEIVELQQKDDTLKHWWLEAQQDQVEDREKSKPRFEVKNGLLWRKKEEERRQVTQLAVPKPLREKVMKLAHDSIMSGHQGVKKTYDRVVAHFFWPGVHGDVERYCHSCDVCQRTVAKGKVPKVPLSKMPLIELPFKRVAVDLVGPIAPMTDRGNRYILTMVDYATRYPEATALKSIEAETVAEALVAMFSRVGIPEEVLTDQGSQFVSGVMKEVSRLLSMRQLVTTPYHPMCNGLVERFNGSLKSMLKRMCSERPKDWDRYLPALLFAYREVPQESLGFSPFELLYGRTVRGPMNILKELWTKQGTEPEVKLTYQYVLELQDRLQDTCEVAKQELSKAQGRQKRYYDVKSRDRKFQVGDKALVLLPTDGNKLLMQWKGPFEIIECRNDNNYRIQLEGRTKLFHANMLKKYIERKKAGEELQVMGAAVIEDSSEVETGEISEFVGKPEETYQNVNVNPQLSTEQKSEVVELLSHFQDVFTDVPKVTTLGEHSIMLTSAEPIRSKAYPLPYAMRGEVDKELDSMLESGVIEPSTAAYASPIVVVKKSDGTNRICIDFRKLNKITIFDPEPMPQMRDIFAELSGSQYFSKFDFCKGYWQVPMRDEDKDLTTFVTHRGLFRFRVMPFGLVNAPATFSRIMRKLLDGLNDLHNYLDDVLGHTVTWSDHVKALYEFLLKVRAANLALKPSKCFVGYTDLVFLGHKVGLEGVSPTDDLTSKIKQASPPTTKKQLRSFLGLVGYYRAFVPNFAAIAVPLTDLTRKGSPNSLVWTEVHDQAFHTLKQCVCSSPILRLPDVSKPFILQTDASCDGIGAILLQEEGEIKHPVAFASKKLLPRERNYSTIEREALAIVWGVQKFENYLMGVHFFLETDHHPLQYLHQAKFQNSRIMRWSLILQPYRFTVRAIKGSDNVGADFLSRHAS